MFVFILRRVTYHVWQSICTVEPGVRILLSSYMHEHFSTWTHEPSTGGGGVKEGVEEVCGGSV